MSGLAYGRGFLLRLLKGLFPFISPLWEMSVQREHEGMIHVTFVASFLSLSPPPSIHQMRELAWLAEWMQMGDTIHATRSHSQVDSRLLSFLVM